MKNRLFTKLFVCLLTVITSISPIAAQRKPVKPKPKPIIFAVLNDGKWVEPIALVDKGELKETSDGGDEPAKILAFTKTYYKKNTVYRLIFGGVDAGSVTIKKNDPNSDCAKNLAEVTTLSTTAKLGGMVMALATNAPITKTKGLRRKPTTAERAEIEALVRAEFTKQNVTAAALKTMRSHNLTALDVNGDGKAELVGSYWVVTSPTSRGLLFFIADKQKNGKYAFGYSEYKNVAQEDVMSGDIKDIDTGIYNELLLDNFDYTGDKVGEIFTFIQSFEGSGFNVYKREYGKWVKTFEGANYHCGF